MLDQLSDVIFRVLREPSGRFAFSEDVSPRFDTGVALDVEAAITEANSRLGRWKEIEEVIPGVAFHLTVNPEASDEGSVVVAADEWKVLGIMAGASSVEEVSRKQGWSEFRSAQLMANMVRRGLLVLADTLPSGRYSYGEETAEPERGSFEVIGSRAQEPRAEESADAEEATSDEAETATTVHTDVSDSDGDRGVLQRRKGLGSIVRESERS